MAVTTSTGSLLNQNITAAKTVTISSVEGSTMFILATFRLQLREDTNTWTAGTRTLHVKLVSNDGSEVVVIAEGDWTFTIDGADTAKRFHLELLTRFIDLNANHLLSVTSDHEDDTNIDLVVSIATMDTDYLLMKKTASGVTDSAVKRVINIDALTKASGAGDLAAALTDTGTTIPALIAALNNVSTANVLTQVNAALDAAISELGVAAPTATPTLRTGLMLLYMALRNKLDVPTSGTDSLEIHNDAGVQIASKVLTDAGGDYSEAKMISG